MSASKQRKAAAENDFEGFLRGVPTSMNRKMAQDLFNNVRKGMNIKEGWNLWQIAPKFDWKNLRENYINEKILESMIGYIENKRVRIIKIGRKNDLIIYNVVSKFIINFMNKLFFCNNGFGRII